MNRVDYTPTCAISSSAISLANGHLSKDIDALMPWAYAQRINGLAPHNELVRDSPTCSWDHLEAVDLTVATKESMGRRRRILLP
ncbi:MAG: hypothetical protein E5W60_18120 [Mesorhizobium sp.]|nr:hypothetical protein EOA32_22390 [Mesorhizobium sp. M1A.F.Ca.ET.072.01.1.1]TIT60739.1 MAG: hypothetical protein E5W60_18120 [Mesorhizobium sp.]TIV04317.1 MAG: hypothetical protein E5W04_04240 [Mesorhizobium sp.]